MLKSLKTPEDNQDLAALVDELLVEIPDQP